MRVRTTIKVADLTIGQWEWVQRNLKLEYDIPENSVRMCVQFELVPEVGPVHREMSVRDFMVILSQLRDIGTDSCMCGRALELGLRPMCPLHGQTTSYPVPNRCHHGADLISQTPSVFIDDGPVWDYEDGCMFHDPYRNMS